MLKALIIDFIEILFIGAAIVLLVWVFLAEPLEVTGDSMYPTLSDKEQLIAEKISPSLTDFKRGDIVVFTSPQSGSLLIKRIIGLPGDEIEIREGRVYVAGQGLSEPYLEPQTKTVGKTKISEGSSIVIPHNEFMLLGDNRNNSTDSRDFGFIKKKDIFGKALLVYHPINNLRLIGNLVDVDFLLFARRIDEVNFAENL